MKVRRLKWHYFSIISGFILNLCLQAKGDHTHSGIDFSKAVPDPETGLECVINEASVDTLEREKLFECVHKSVNICHYAYVTRFRNQRVEECKDHYEKICNIGYHQDPVNETVLHCYAPLEKKCSEQVDETNIICRVYLESECVTRYVEKSSQKFVADTSCEKIPRQYCAATGCKFVTGERQCHNKTVQSAVDVPEENCDLVPQKTCQGTNKLVPYLVPEPVCEDVPLEVCTFGVKSTSQTTKPLITKWCIKPGEIPLRDETYAEEGAGAPPIGPEPGHSPRPTPRPTPGPTPRPLPVVTDVPGLEIPEQDIGQKPQAAQTTAAPAPTLPTGYLPPRVAGTASSDLGSRQSKEFTDNVALFLPFQPAMPDESLAEVNNFDNFDHVDKKPSNSNLEGEYTYDYYDDQQEDDDVTNRQPRVEDYYDTTEFTTEQSDLLTTNSDVITTNSDFFESELDSTNGSIVFEENIPTDLHKIINPSLKPNVKIAKASGKEAHKLAAKTSLATVIKHKGDDSPVDKTIIIKSSPQAFQLFGVKNVPKDILNGKRTESQENFSSQEEDIGITQGDDESSDSGDFAHEQRTTNTRPFPNNIFDKLTDGDETVTPASLTTLPVDIDITRPGDIDNTRPVDVDFTRPVDFDISNTFNGEKSNPVNVDTSDVLNVDNLNPVDVVTSDGIPVLDATKFQTSNEDIRNSEQRQPKNFASGFDDSFVSDFNSDSGRHQNIVEVGNAPQQNSALSGNRQQVNYAGGQISNQVVSGGSSAQSNGQVFQGVQHEASGQTNIESGTVHQNQVTGQESGGFRQLHQDQYQQGSLHPAQGGQQQFSQQGQVLSHQQGQRNPSGNVFLPNQAPSYSSSNTGFQVNSITSLNQLNPSNDPLVFNNQQGNSYQGSSFPESDYQGENSIRTTRDPPSLGQGNYGGNGGNGGNFKSPPLQYGFKPLTTASLQQSTVQYQRPVTEATPYNSVSPMLMYGFSPLPGASNSGRVRSPSPTYTTGSTHASSAATYSATTVSGQAQQTQAHPTPRPNRQRPKQNKKRQKRKNFLHRMIDAIMKPISNTVHAMMSG